MFEPRNKIWVGKRRQGKTLAMVRELRKALIHGIPVYSNITIRFEHKNRCYFSYYIRSGDDFFRVMHKAKNAIIAADEIGLVFPNQFWNRLPLSALAMFKESGHVGIAFWGTTHNLGDIVGKLRSLVDDLYLCNKRRWFIFNKFLYIKKPSNIFRAIFLPTPRNISALFTHKKRTVYNQVIKWNDTFTWTPAYVFHESQMKPSYKGDGGARQYINNLIRKRKMYPCEYVKCMRSYDTKQMIDYNVMVSGASSPTKRRANNRPAYKAKTQQQQSPSLIEKAESTLESSKKVLRETAYIN